MRFLLALGLMAVASPLPAQTGTVAMAGDHSRVGISVPMGGTARINGKTFRPVAIVEDSRCPPNANCVWAGRLVVEFETRGRRKTRLTLGQPVPMPGGQLTLVSANGPGAAGTPMRPQDYVFRIWFYGR